MFVWKSQKAENKSRTCTFVSICIFVFVHVRACAFVCNKTKIIVCHQDQGWSSGLCGEGTRLWRQPKKLTQGYGDSYRWSSK